MSDPSGPASPGPSVVVRGGTEPTAVDTATISAKACVVLGAAGAIAAARDGCRLARGALEDAGPATFTARPFGSGSAPSFDAPSVRGVPVLPTWSSEVVRAKAAALAELEVAVTEAAAQEQAVRAIGERMLQAVRVYDDAELAAAATMGEVGVAARSLVLSQRLGGGPLGVLLATGAELVLQGTAGFVAAGVTGHGFSPARLLTSTEGRHAPTVSWLSRWIGLLDPRRDPGRAPTVGNAAWVLGFPLRELRSRWAPEPVVTRLTTPDDAVLPDPVDARTAFDAVAAMSGTQHLPGSVLSIQRIDKGEGLPPTWVVAIPGTQTGEERTVFGWTSNLLLMDADPSVRTQADSVRAVLAAMEDAEIPPGDDVVLVGHSQGGMVAATVAAATVGTYSVRHVVTAGSPLATHDLPPGVKGTHVETQGEGVSDTDGAENPATPDRVTVTGRYPGFGGSSVWPHGVEFHQETLAAAEAVGDRGLDEHLDDIETLLTGDHDEPMLYEARLAPRAEPERCTRPVGGPAGLGGPFTGPFGPGGPFGTSGPGWDRGPTLLPAPRSGAPHG